MRLGILRRCKFTSIGQEDIVFGADLMMKFKWIWRAGTQQPPRKLPHIKLVSFLAVPYNV